MEMAMATTDKQVPVAEVVVKVDPRKQWEDLIWTRNRNKCSNCGGTDRLRVKMIVPVEAGGKLVESNGVLLCRPCELAADAVSSPKSGEDRRPINFWVSQPLYKALSEADGFSSMSSLVRFLMSRYVADEGRFDDLEQYQDESGGDSVKVNVWVENDCYGTFKELVTRRGLTVTDAIKALVKMFQTNESERSA
jgi:hypothetical protein